MINIKRSCELFEISKSSYYKSKSKKESLRSQKRKSDVLEIKKEFLKEKKRYGAPKIKNRLECRGLIIGINRVRRLMREEGLIPIVLKKYRYSTKKSKNVEGLKNVLNRDFKSERYGEKIVGDITYIWTKDCGWCYLASYMDLYNNEILSWNFQRKMDMSLVMTALEKIPSKHIKGSVVHTDRGSQYTSKEMRKKLKKLGALESFSRKGNPWDNACIESFHATLKKELIYDMGAKSYEDTREAIFEFIEGWYNNERIQKRLGYLSPAEYLIKAS